MPTIRDIRELIYNSSVDDVNKTSLLGALEMLGFGDTFCVQDDTIQFLRHENFNLLGAQIQNGVDSVETADIARAYADIVNELFDNIL